MIGKDQIIIRRRLFSYIHFLFSYKRENIETCFNAAASHYGIFIFSFNHVCPTCVSRDRIRLRVHMMYNFLSMPSKRAHTHTLDNGTL